MRHHRSFLAVAVAVATVTTAVSSNAAPPPGGGASSPIDHVVVLMLENRAFDHMLGWMKRDNPAIDGLSGDEYNLLDPSNPASQKLFVQSNASYVDPDPDHSVHGTTHEIYADGTTPTMGGFARQAVRRRIPPMSVLSGFAPEDVPVITTLASEFTMVDSFHAAIPGPTLPNRLMFHSATSHGDCTDNVWEQVKGHPQKPLYQALQEAGVDWSVYFEEAPDVLILDWMRKISNWDKYKWYSDFEKDVTHGKLANFSFINPVYYSLPGMPASDQHPSHDVVDGEKLIKNVYETLRNSPYWERSLLIVTYDEHGGFYDHVAPPTEGVPNPDGLNCTDLNHTDFHFDRLGVRIPFILASPWVNKGVVEHEPLYKPTPTSAYDLTSVAASMHYHFNTSSFLTRRDAWAAPLNHLWSRRTAPRTDCPTRLPDPPAESKAFEGHRGRFLRSGEASLSDLQRKFIEIAARLEITEESSEERQRAIARAAMLQSEVEGSLFVRDRVNRFLGRDPLAQPTHPLHGKTSHLRKQPLL